MVHSYIVTFIVFTGAALIIDHRSSLISINVSHEDGDDPRSHVLIQMSLPVSISALLASSVRCVAVFYT